MKYCRLCKEYRPLAEFREDPRMKSGYEGRCMKCANQNSLNWYHRNRESQIAKKKAYRANVRAQVLALYGGACTCCGERTPEFLSIDHVYSDGAEHRKTVGSGYAMYLWLIKNPVSDRFQILCHNCNMAKGFYGLCPHQARVDDQVWLTDDFYGERVEAV